MEELQKQIREVRMSAELGTTDKDLANFMYKWCETRTPQEKVELDEGSVLNVIETTDTKLSFPRYTEHRVRLAKAICSTFKPKELSVDEIAKDLYELFYIHRGIGATACQIPWESSRKHEKDIYLKVAKSIKDKLSCQINKRKLRSVESK